MNIGEPKSFRIAFTSFRCDARGRLDLANTLTSSSHWVNAIASFSDTNCFRMASSSGFTVTSVVFKKWCAQWQIAYSRKYPTPLLSSPLSDSPPSISIASSVSSSSNMKGSRPRLATVKLLIDTEYSGSSFIYSRTEAWTNDTWPEL